MGLLHKVIFDNTILSYLVVAGTIIFMLLAKRFLSHYIASLLYLAVKSNWKNIEKKDFIALIIRPLSWFITISVAVFAIDKLNFPQQFVYKIYGHPTDEILQRIGMGLIVSYFFWLLVSCISFVALIFEQKAKLTKDKADDQLIIFLRDFLKAVVIIFGILMVIKVVFSQNVGSVITGLSIVGAALALAAKESLENLIASFVIFFDKPFYTGDTLKVNNVTGTVEHVGLRSTRIRTADKTLVTVPNKQMVDSIVDNMSMRTQRRAEIKLEFDPKTTTQKIETFIEAIKKILAAENEKIEKYSVFFSDFSKSSAIVTIEYFTIHFSMTEYNTLKQQINVLIKKNIEDLQLELASGGADINIFSGDAGATPVKNQPLI